MLAAAFFLSGIVHPLFALGSVEETVTDVLTRLALLVMPFVAYIAAAGRRPPLYRCRTQGERWA